LLKGSQLVGISIKKRQDLGTTAAALAGKQEQTTLHD